MTGSLPSAVPRRRRHSLRAVRRYLVVDLEATCGDELLDHERETIEIGAVLVDAATLSPIREFQSFVRPVRHPRLTAFCTELTGITQPMVDAAPEFEDTIVPMVEAIGDPWGTVWAAWGEFDAEQFALDCYRGGIENPYAVMEAMDCKAVFSFAQGRRKRLGMAKALRLCGLERAGAAHRGIDDARNLVRMLPWIVGGKRVAT